jgi:hypothetical protein
MRRYGFGRPVLLGAIYEGRLAARRSGTGRTAPYLISTESLERYLATARPGPKPKVTPAAARPLAAGRALDAAIAERVFGGARAQAQWYRRPARTPPPPDGAPRYAGPAFSTELAAAVRVFDRWEGDVAVRRQGGLWRVELLRPPERFDAWADTLPLAICAAALKALAP